jgi:hypothetical protein
VHGMSRVLAANPPNERKCHKEMCREGTVCFKFYRTVRSIFKILSQPSANKSKNNATVGEYKMRLGATVKANQFYGKLKQCPTN